MDMNHLLHKTQAVFFRLAMWFEVVFALIIFGGVVLHIMHIPASILDPHTEFIDFLQYLLEGLVGLELIMMLCRHDLDSIIEVMIFTVTKYLVVNHESAVGILIGVAAVAVLFAIRKFLFLSAEELAERKKHADYIQRDK
ncbi:MAG: hypothetical protein IJT43_05475 [Stomatobaculum sp.]|nr:hypothetical protein [Stomatobaculum sp.]